MAGHSKWANIKFRKAQQDAKRGKLFTKFIREITIAARLGGEDASSNPRLRDAIDKALTANMKRDTINNAIKRGVGSDEGGNLAEIRYEGYGPQGIAIIVDTMTDNKNRTVSEVRHAFTKHGGNLGTDGSVSYQFHHRGVISYAAGTNEEALMSAALEAGADDIKTLADGSFEVYTNISNFHAVKQTLIDAGLTPENAELTWQADNLVTVEAASAESLVKLIDALEELDDVQEVYSNAEIPDDVLASMT